MTYKNPVITLPLFRFRAWLMIRIVEWSGPIYCKIRMRLSVIRSRLGRSARPPVAYWHHRKSTLVHYKQGSLGEALYSFLLANDFELLPGAETHDVFHVLLGYGTTAVEEVCLQCCLYGSGKRSFYLLGAVCFGVLIFPEYWSLFQKAYQRGRGMVNFSKWSFEYLLHEPIDLLQALASESIKTAPMLKLNPIIF